MTTSTEKRLGIWMDHSNAHFIEITSDGKDEIVITSSYTHQKNDGHPSNGDMHKQKHQQAEFYKKLGEEVKRFDEVILFGPTNAKEELLNTFKEDHHFEKIKIHVEQADKLTEIQQHAFLRNYLSKYLTNHQYEKNT